MSGINKSPLKIFFNNVYAADIQPFIISVAYRKILKPSSEFAFTYLLYSTRKSLRYAKLARM